MCYAELAGNVVINQGTQQIAADKVVLEKHLRVWLLLRVKLLFTDQATGNAQRQRSKAIVEIVIAITLKPKINW
jgi:LPS-assembly protein